MYSDLATDQAPPNLLPLFMNTRGAIIGAVFSISILLTAQCLPAPAAPEAASVAQYDGVTIKKNADGSLEVYDVEDAAHAQKSAAATTAASATTTASDTVSSAEIAAKVPAGTPATVAIENGTTATATETNALAAPAAESLFAVQPVIVKKAPKSTAARPWSHGISAL